MQLMLKAIKPHSYELVWYLLFGTLGIVLLNLSGIIDTFFTVSGTDSDVQNYIDSSFVGVLQSISAPLNGRLGNSVIWAFMGVVAFTLGSIAVASIQDLLDHSDEARKAPRKLRGPVWVEFIVRACVRTIALVSLFVWVYVSAAYIIPFVSRLLLESLLAPTPFLWGTLAFALGVCAISLVLYVAAVLCRFIALRVRVFSSVT